MSRTAVDHLPRALRRSGIKRDNIALVRAALLPCRTQWQAFANTLPAGGVIIVLPARGHSKAIARVAAQLEVNGHPVTRLPAARFVARP